MNTDTDTAATTITTVVDGTIKPTHIFLIPIRNRDKQQRDFLENMIPVLDKDLGSGNWLILFISDNEPRRPFNRGALINTGFLEVKARYPDTWPDIILIPHDVDIYIKSNTNNNQLPPYSYKECPDGIVRHPYGERDVNKGPMLGCFCIIRAKDYAAINGMPNYFGWGVEDLTMAKRCLAAGITIDESNMILRYSDNRIYDEISHRTAEDLTYIRACHDRNLQLLVGELSRGADIGGSSGISTVTYQTVNESSPVRNVATVLVNFKADGR